MYARAALALALLLGAAGCSKMSPESSYGDYYDYSGDAAAAEAPSMGMEAERTVSADFDAPSRRERRMSRKDVASTAPPAPARRARLVDPRGQWRCRRWWRW